MERTVTLRVYEELNDYLPPSCRKRAFEFPLAPATDVEALLRDLGLPAGEVDLVLVDGEPAGLAQPLSGGERVSVYPVFEAFDVSRDTRVRAGALRSPRFALPHELWPLAQKLRGLGYPVREAHPDEPPAGWILITAAATPRPAVKPAHHLRLSETQPAAQLRELRTRLQLD